MTAPAHPLACDAALLERARAVIPGAMYGHQSAARLPAAFPQFLAGGRGARIRDVDGNEYVDLMCSYGAVVLGHHHPAVDRAVEAQLRDGDCQNGPSARMVELAELLVETVRHAGWAMFAKNGTDATTLALTVARAGTKRRKIAVAEGSYHGAAPWCTPIATGVTAEERAHLLRFAYNDIESLEAVVELAAGDLAGVIVTPYRQDIGRPQEPADPAFARRLREICDREEAALIIDEVRCGFRLAHGASWDALGVEADLSAWSKAIANGHPLSALLGNERFRTAATEIYATGSFWFAAAPMAAAIATIEALQHEDAVRTMVARGRELRAGLAEQADRWELPVLLSGPDQMPFLTFAADDSFELANVFADEAARSGAYLHPRHNWFLSAATTAEDIADALEATELAFAAVRNHVDSNGRDG